MDAKAQTSDRLTWQTSTVVGCFIWHVTRAYRDQWGNPSDEISGTGAMAVLLEQQLCRHNQPSLLKVVSVEIEAKILDP